MQTLRENSPGGSTFPREMTSWPLSWNYDVISEIRLRQSMRIYTWGKSCEISSRSDLKRRNVIIFPRQGRGSGFVISVHFWILICDLLHTAVHFGDEPGEGLGAAAPWDWQSHYFSGKRYFFGQKPAAKN